ncbi:phosphoglycerate mutase-like protein [Xylariaceae sp. FL1019]|nr:phosphoglycerate mutase-like protein [Xylariaceae sp. FL1019]
MSLKFIYVVRHGFRSSWSVDNAGNYTAHLRSPTGLPTDPALTSHGVEQANDLAEHLLGIKPPIELVYSSPYYRCLQTISPFVTKHNALRRQKSTLTGSSTQNSPLGIRAEAGLSEWYGRAHFDHPTSAPLSDLCNLFGDVDASYVSLPGPRRKGESIPQLYERVAACLRSIIARSDQEEKQSVVICTHAAVVIVLGRLLTGQIPADPNEEDFRAFTCGLSIYRRQDVRTNASNNDGNDTATVFDRQEHGSSSEPIIRSRLDFPTSHRNDRRALDSDATGSRTPSWRCGINMSSSWTCEANSTCNFLSGGEERGWRFSGDESFIDFSEEGLLSSDIEPDAQAAGHDDENSIGVCTSYKL